VFSLFLYDHFFPRDAMPAQYCCHRVCVYLSVRLPGHYPVLYSERLKESKLYLAWRHPSSYPTLCCKKIRISPKITVLPCGTLSRTSDLENFTTASRSRCQQNSSSSSSSSTVELVDDTYTTIDKSWLFTTSRSTVTL